jgi:hypothetical protein
MENKKIYLLILLILLFITGQIKAQKVQGEWSDHLSYTICYRIADAGNTIFCAAESGMLSYNKETGEIQRHSKITGLSDVEVGTIAFSNTHNKLIIGYKNGNIDIINMSDEPLHNLSDIKRKSITGNKNINNIFLYQETAYLSCSFGIVVLDINNEEIKDSYFFGAGGTEIHVYDVTIFNNKIYAATESGVYEADLNSPNLVDFNYWSRLNYIPQPTTSYKLIETHNNSLYAVYTETSSEEDIIITIGNDNYQQWYGQYNDIVNDISSTNGYFTVSCSDRGLVYGPGETIYLDFTIHNTNHILVDSESNVFVASSYSGFSNQLNNTDVKQLSVNAPRYREVSKVETKGNHIWVSSGGPQNLYIHGAAYHYYENKWTSYTASQIPTSKILGNTYKFAIDPNDHSHVFAAAFHYGMIEFRDGEVVNTFEKDDLEIFDDIDDITDLRPVGIEYDEEGNLYILLSLVSRPLVILNNEGNWSRPEISNSLLNRDRIVYSDLLITSTGQIWICGRDDGIVVLENDGEDNFYSNSFTLKNQDGNTLAKAYCLNEDNEGNIWVGTDNGPLIYYSPAYILNESGIEGYQIVIPRNDGTNNADYLLSGEQILDIETDGGNRNWFATSSSGVFLITDDGMNTIHNFRENNSPMLSNSVSGIGINEKNGEVFIATNLGLISYHGSATKGFSDYTDVYVYPNPVRPDFEGIITITGLVENSIVKITDVSGNLVYETTSLGGQAIWDGTNFDGRRVASGVYLVFLATEDGGKSHITKLLFLH